MTLPMRHHRDRHGTVTVVLIKKTAQVSRSYALMTLMTLVTVSRGLILGGVEGPRRLRTAALALAGNACEPRH